MWVAASLSLVVVLIVALDWPFRGEVSISTDDYVKAQQSWGDLPFANGAATSAKTEEPDAITKPMANRTAHRALTTRPFAPVKARSLKAADHGG
jgi:hypothetical protein